MLAISVLLIGYVAAAILIYTAQPHDDMPKSVDAVAAITWPLWGFTLMTMVALVFVLLLGIIPIIITHTLVTKKRKDNHESAS